jgi:Glyoxalase-like domain
MLAAKTVSEPGRDRPMASSFQLVIDRADPEPLARFWATALGYELAAADWLRQLG